MNAITFEISADLHDEIQAVARQKGVSVNELLAETTKSIIVAHRAEERFRARAAQGQGREAEALALLNRS